ncbi:chaperone protein dnaJ C76, chloroplastic [Telopea speciosissima]|uniref:chaperone protein dnaJ C76, chloroplastic n=1 Tax=Telopea speciosissima TaxID=54955 RepID=UPI001CC66475|nr:chaperone protein dnaJ C76, chloroplastic [Telopea speciosissima]
MGTLFLRSRFIPFRKAVNTVNSGEFPRSVTNSNPICFPSSSRIFPLTVNCRGSGGEEDDWLSTSSPYDVLGVEKNCSPADLKAAFRARVKEFHPDVRKDAGESDVKIRRVIQAYEMLSKSLQLETTESECLDPFEKPECEAFDVFINETLCVGKGCPFSCVKRAPYVFSFVSSTGTARAMKQGHNEDYQVQLAVGQCPRKCIHYVTPSQRVILEELLESVLNVPYDSSAEADLLYSLITKAQFENNRYQKPKKQPKASGKHVDWF